MGDLVSTTISYSTLSPSAVIAHIAREYKVGEITSCEFLARGLNDTSRVQASDRSYAFRVYRAGWRSQSEIQYELDVLTHLIEEGLGLDTNSGKRRTLALPHRAT